MWLKIQAAGPAQVVVLGEFAFDGVPPFPLVEL